MASLSTCHLGLWLGWQILLNLVCRCVFVCRRCVFVGTSVRVGVYWFVCFNLQFFSFSRNYHFKVITMIVTYDHEFCDWCLIVDCCAMFIAVANGPRTDPPTEGSSHWSG